MKTKAYKLAAELGLKEQSVLEWLRKNGYPNARRADTIRADVAQAARRELGRRRTRRISKRVTGATTHRSRPNKSSGKGRKSSGSDSSGFKMSFADLLESHLPQGAEAGKAPLPEVSARGGPTLPTPTKVPAPTPRAPSDEELRLRIARAEQQRDEARREVGVLRQRVEAEHRELELVRTELTAAKQNLTALDSVRADLDRAQLERARLGKALREAQDERATLAATCAELQGELTEAKRDAERSGSDQHAHESLVNDLESAMQREMAWRARALELERAQSQDLPGLLQSLGLKDFADQARVLTALLANRDTALSLMRAIRQVESGPVERMIKQRVRRVCSHPICNQVTQQDDRVVLRVDDEGGCEVCGGQPDRRWFQRMVRECNRAGVRRLLVIGGDTVHESLRELSQGQPVDLRLVTGDEEAQSARVRGRVEGCDVLVLWSTWVVDESVSELYAGAAHREGRLTVSVLGERCEVAPMARAVCNRLARNHVLVAN